jgi:hypothetical protein
MLLDVVRVAVVNEWPTTSILYLSHHMVIFYVRELATILYIWHEVPFCKKCAIEIMLNTHTHTHTHTFHGTFFYESHCSTFYVYECI